VRPVGAHREHGAPGRIAGRHDREIEASPTRTGTSVQEVNRRSFADFFLSTGIWLLWIALLVPAGVVGWGIGHHGHGGTKTVTVTIGASGTTAAAPAINAAPAFSGADLAKEPIDNWLTNGGSLLNQRYSPLTQIDTSNISQLKGVWLTHLRKSALAAKYSAESQPLVYDGVIYVPTGEDDVFAISADTGKIIWEHKGNLNQAISTVCCGWESRGVALGDGRVYIGQIDGKLVALDQKTGKLVWSTQVMAWQRGYSITSAPLYVDGMVVTGISGGEFGIRGRVTAFDAKTGKEVWRFYTIPGPGETGHETWPQTGNAWKHGGAPVWQTPSVDPNLGLLYFSTGNAGPDNDGGHRAGDNLFAASMVALDVKTGKLKWHYQMVHHDIWDYDAPSPTVLFDAEIDGKTVHGIGEAEKTGWLYLLDRETGKPIFPIPERAVPQNAHQKTAKTQPIPSYAPFVPHVPTQAQYREVVKLASKAAGHPVKAIRAKTMYTPYWKTLTVLTPGPQGGTNWQPSSYNPNTHMFYVCAQSGITGNTAETGKPAKQKAVAQVTIGSTLTIGGGFGQNSGTFTAIDATTGKIAWQKRWPESCYAGSATTAGNLVFIGRNNGELQAYDARNGKQLWSFQTGAGANDAPTIFQRNGKEYVVFYAGGNALAATAHGDNLWLFGLDGKLGPVPGPGAGAGIGHAGEAAGPTSSKGNAAAGKSVFASNCATCHGADGHGGNGGPDLTSIPSAKNLARVLRQVENGGAGMPAFKGTLPQKQINDVAAYVVKNITHG
jgi:quinohemoprotein ethanol dehydrogenase